MVGESGGYWAQVGEDLEVRPANPWWRAYCDGLNRRWLRQALGGRTFRRALKTDLFDEAVGGGVDRGLADRLVGIDVGVPTVRLALRRGDLQALAADARLLPFSDGAFDLVISLSTLDHFSSADEISRALLEMKRVLAPGGILALTLDNLSNPYIRLRNALPWPLLHRSRLVPYFVGVTLTRRQLEERLRASGFRVLQSTALMHTLRLLMVPLVARMGGPFLLRWLEALESLGRLPTCYRTGLYLAVIAEATGP